MGIPHNPKPSPKPVFKMANIAQALNDVKGGTRAVIFDRLSGVKEDVINEGTHFLVPWLQRSIIFDVRTKPRSISTTTGSKDLQMVSYRQRSPQGYCRPVRCC